MLGIDSEIGTSAFRLWIAAGSAALLFVFCALVFLRQSANPSWRAGMVVLGAVSGAAMTWAFLDHGTQEDRAAERRSLELRADELSARALAPGSPLACLDASAGESVDAACEKAVFASPANVATASSYVAARLTLLAAMTAYAQRGGGDIESAMQPLRHALEVDRFGFVAHVLAVRDGCTSGNCKALGRLRDAARVQANFTAQTLDRYIEHYQEVWAKMPDTPSAEAAPAQPSPSAAVARKVVNVDFPSASSIPAISIMNPEPNGPVLPGVAAAAATNPNPQQAVSQASRRSHKQTPNPAVQTASQPATPGSAAVEPIWPEPMPPAPAAAAPANAPVQLTPPAPSASAGPTARAQ
jgi:hypothetical protein